MGAAKCRALFYNLLILINMATSKKEDDQKKVLQAQADQLFGKTDKHAPAKPERLDYVLNGAPSYGAPVAQGMNLSKEESEFAANLAASGEEKPQPEKTPASTEVPQ